MSWLTASDVLNHVYCPRITYFQKVLGIRQATTSKEIKGREKSSVAERRAIKRPLKQARHYRAEKRVSLENPDECLRTVADVVLFDDALKEAVPLQIKWSASKPKIFLGQRIQLQLEAELIEDCKGYKVLQGFIKYARQGQAFAIPLVDRKELHTTLQEIKDVIRTETIPEPTQHKRKCIDCCYRKICQRNCL